MVVILTVESKHKKGTKFIVKLPLNIDAKPEDVENVKNEFLINSMKAVEYDMLTSERSFTKRKKITDGLTRRF